MPTPPSKKRSGARGGAAKKSAVKKSAAKKRAAPRQVRAVGQGILMQIGMNQFADAPTAAKLKTELSPGEKATKSLLEVAQELAVIDPGSWPEETRILARLAGTPQEDMIRTAIFDALNAGRRIQYYCGIENPKLVNDIHCHIHVDQSTTVLEFVPGQSH
jgi:hypothetical protein